MANYEIINQKPIHTSRVFDEISTRTQNREMTYREERTLEYLKKFNKLSAKQFEEAYSELVSLEIPRIEEFQLIKILEIMPKNGPELRAIISHGGVVVVDETVTQILDVLKKFQ
ncbi:MAG: hypothetical protein ACLFPL_00485 [Candidatus Nanoarchaeia archaeon]